MARYLIGTRVRISATIRRLPEGELADPTSVSLRLRHLQSGKVTVHGLSRDGQGQYHCDLEPASAGSYWYRLQASGNIMAASEGHFLVLPSKVV